MRVSLDVGMTTFRNAALEEGGSRQVPQDLTVEIVVNARDAYQIRKLAHFRREGISFRHCRPCLAI